jgi:flagellar operon protein
MASVRKEGWIMDINKIQNTQILGQSGVHAKGVSESRQAGQADFANILKSKVEELKFSAHAQSRLKSRNIAMTPQVMEKLSKAVSGARSKGANNSLVLLKDMAFIVNVPNRTVVTAMDGESIRDNVFTNIDSTVIAG